VQEAENLGVAVDGLQGLTPRQCCETVAAGVREFCAAKGRAHGMGYAEQFRYEKLGILEKHLGRELIAPDFG
jgi:hypothetical protein